MATIASYDTRGVGDNVLEAITAALLPYGELEAAEPIELF